MADTEKVAMNCKLTIVEQSDCLSLNISNFDTGAANLVRERLGEIETMLREILSFDEVVAQLSESDLVRLQPAVAAMDLKYQTIVNAATHQARSANNVADGSESISDHGFPEFDYE